MATVPLARLQVHDPTGRLPQTTEEAHPLGPDRVALRVRAQGSARQLQKQTY